VRDRVIYVFIAPFMALPSTALPTQEQRKLDRLLRSGIKRVRERALCTHMHVYAQQSVHVQAAASLLKAHSSSTVVMLTGSSGSLASQH
jgi:hypothetical protein